MSSIIKVDTIQLADGTAGTIENLGLATGALSHRNLIINGAMQVAQRGTSEIGTSNYLLDRWKKQSATNANVTFSQDTADTPDGFRYAFKALATGSSAFIQLGQPIEFKNMAHAVGKTVTLSYWAKTNLSFYSRIRSRTDTEDGVTIFSANTLSVITESASTDWKLFTHTFTIPSATLAMSVDFSAGALVSGDYFHITGVQLEVGSVATPFEHRSYGEELAKCQRYYEVIRQNQQFGGDGYNTINTATSNGSYIYTSWLFKVTKRTKPSVGIGNSAKFRAFGNGSTANLTANEYYSPGTEATRIRCSGVFNAGEAVMLEFDAANSTNGFIYADAEL